MCEKEAKKTKLIIRSFFNKHKILCQKHRDLGFIDFLVCTDWNQSL